MDGLAHQRVDVEGLAAACRSILERWRDRGIIAGFLYGSILGSRHRSDSDVDIALLDRADRRLGWADQSRLMDELERAIGMTVDLRMLRDTPLSHQVHVLRKGRPVWIADNGGTTAYVRSIESQYDAQHGSALQASPPTSSDGGETG